MIPKYQVSFENNSDSKANKCHVVELMPSPSGKCLIATVTETFGGDAKGLVDAVNKAFDLNYLELMKGKQYVK